MLNAYLMKEGGHKRTKFYDFTEPYFIQLNDGYRIALTKFMTKKDGAILLYSLVWV